MEKDNLLFKDECYEIIGACMEVYNELGSGFLEPIYQEALEIELLMKSIPFEREKLLNVFYKKNKLKKKYIADFVCFNSIIVELKAVNEFSGVHTSQVLNYLKATDNKLALLINFGKDKLEYKRIIR